MRVGFAFFLIRLPTYPCWMSSFSFATFLSSITVKDKTQSQRAVYDIVPQEQLSPMTVSMQCLITSLVSQTNTRKTPAHKTALRRHAFKTHVQPSLTSSDFFAELGVADETVQFLRRFLQHSGVHWEGKATQVTTLL